MMANADKTHLIAAAVAALDLDSAMPPNARLWLARASLRCDPKGRTRYGPARYSADVRDTEESGRAAIDWLTNAGIVLNDTDDDGIECWRLTHHEWAKDYATITGYGRDAGQKRDGLPPQYGRTVADVIEPNGKRYRPPSGTDWRQLVTEEPPA